MGFFSSLLGGSNPTLSADIGKFGQIGGFATGLGERNVAQGSKFFSDIVSGDPTKQARALAPEISSIQGQKEQSLKSMAEFGNRSGGTNAAAQMAGDTARASFNNMIAQLLGTSASSLLSSGSSLLSTGVGAYGSQVDASQLQMQNWANSILGQGISQGVGFGEGYGLGKLPGVKAPGATAPA